MTEVLGCHNGSVCVTETSVALEVVGRATLKIASQFCHSGSACVTDTSVTEVLG